jgi:hypothetical protein
MSTITGIRSAKNTDIDAITDIHVSSWREVYRFMPDAVLDKRGRDYRKTQWQTWFQDPPDGEATFVLEGGDRVVGFAQAKPNRDPDIDAEGEFHACYILPAYRGGVAGPLAMMALAVHLQEHDFFPACIWAFRKNKHRLIYNQIGCKPTIFRDRIIEGTALPEIGYLAPGFTELMARLHRMYASGLRRQNLSPRLPIQLTRLTG